MHPKNVACPKDLDLTLLVAMNQLSWSSSFYNRNNVKILKEP